MDINFSCPNCNQQLTADPTMAGDDIACPSCGTVMRVPAAPAAEEVVLEAPLLTPTSGSGRQRIQLNAAANTAAGDALIQKPIKPLEAAAKAGIRVYVKTFRHGDYLVGGNGFDEVVSTFLQEVGEPHLMHIYPIHYSRMDSETKQIVADYGVVIVYRREG